MEGFGGKVEWMSLWHDRASLARYERQVVHTAGAGTVKNELFKRRSKRSEKRTCDRVAFQSLQKGGEWIGLEPNIRSSKTPRASSMARRCWRMVLVPVACASMSRKWKDEESLIASGEPESPQ